MAVMETRFIVCPTYALAAILSSQFCHSHKADPIVK